MKLQPMFANQKFSTKFMAKQPKVFDMSDPGCVSADTEFLTPSGWQRIDSYKDGLVAQFHPETRTISFVKPIDYIKRPCKKMIAIAPSRGMSQRLSHEHRVLYYRRDGSHDVKSAVDFMYDLHKRGPFRANAKFCSTFTVETTSKMSLVDAHIRLMVAVIADGHFPTATTNYCVIRIKKQRKITRLRELLAASAIKYRVRQCGGADPEFAIFTFYAPLHHKEFNTYWWSASQHQLEIIADEVCYWDSSEDSRDSNGTRFSTLVESSADFIQYAFAAAKRPTSLTFAVRDRSAENRGVSIEYTVHAQDKDKFIGPGRANSVYEVDNPEGFKYCFEVPTSFLLLRHNGYIFATGNTGKTRVGIEAFATRRRKGGKCLLVVAPKSLLAAAWKNDFNKFAPDMSCVIANAANREAAFKIPADVYITNHDAAVWLQKQKPAFFKHFDTLEIDESTAFKHHTSARSKAMAKVAKNFTYIRLASGTPTSNGICDLWHQMMILDQGKRLGTSYFGFRAAACNPQQFEAAGKTFMNWTDKPGIEGIVGALIKDVVIRHRFEDCVDIPENHKYAVSYQLSKTHMTSYKEMESERILFMQNNVITAANAAVVYTKLLQIASGAVYDGEGGHTVVDNGRYELVLDLIQARKHTVTFFTWKHQRDMLIAEAEKRGISYAVIDGEASDKDREQIVKNYQAGVYQTLFAHPQSAGHGLTLTKGTATIWASPTINLEHFAQGWKRVHRIGQTEKTETIVVIAEGTLDEKVWKAMQGKETNMSDFLNELKELTK